MSIAAHLPVQSARFTQRVTLSLRPRGTLLPLSSILVGALLLTGCEQPQAPLRNRSRPTQRTAKSHLDKAVEFLKRFDEFEKQQAARQTTYHLNSWMDQQTPPGDWQADEMIRTLPRAIREGPAIAQLDRTQFQISDADQLREVAWLQSLAGWVPNRPDPSPLQDELARQAAQLESPAREQLMLAYRLFDWTVRNVHLDELLEYPADPVAVGSESSWRPAPMRLVPGPGYQLQPWQVLLYGHGDALGRARVFLLLARQHGIPVVMLAFPGLTSTPRPRPWMTAALIDQQLYLFDTQLGIPIPGPEDQLVATLENVLDDPELLSSMAVGNEFSYEIADRDKKRIQALIDASPAALALRTQMVEEQLTGENRLKLTVNASRLAKQLKACRGIDDVKLWTLPYEAAWYRDALEAAMEKDERVAAQYYLRYGVFETRATLVRGRYAHFRGQFENEGEKKGAKMLYLESRIPDSRIEQIATSPEVQQEFGLQRRPNEHEQAYLNRLTNVRIMVMQTKAYASYWLGLAHFDAGDPESAIEWFQGRILEDDDEANPWADGASYNLARAHEALGDIEKARDILLADRSHQQHGNVLRARLLRRARKTAAETAPDAAP